MPCLHLCEVATAIIENDWLYQVAKLKNTLSHKEVTIDDSISMTANITTEDNLQEYKSHVKVLANPQPICSLFGTDSKIKNC